MRVAEKAMRKSRVAIRTVNMKNFRAEADAIWNIYSSAWSGNWGFAPLPKEDARESDPKYRLQEVKQVDLVQDVEVGRCRVAEGVPDGLGEEHGGHRLGPDRYRGQGQPPAPAEAAK